MTRKQAMKLRRNAKFTVVVGAILYMVVSIASAANRTSATENVYPAISDKPVKAEVSATVERPPDEPVTIEVESLEYPFNTMSSDFGDEIEGFQEYSIPEEYARYGGYLPLLVQQYTYCVCKNYGIDYAVVLAMIEVESGYKYNAVSSCNALGYMQIVQTWHEDRMERLGVSDLLNPYQNIMVGVDFLSELIDEYGDINLALMIYNRGFHNSAGTGALDLWEAGQHSTEYTRNIMNRAGEIGKEIGYAQD